MDKEPSLFISIEILYTLEVTSAQINDITKTCLYLQYFLIFCNDICKLFIFYLFLKQYFIPLHRNLKYYFNKWLAKTL